MPAERTGHTDDSPLTAPLLAITEWSLRAPLTVLSGAVGLALVALVVTVSGLTFKTSRLDLLNPRSEYHRRWLAYMAEFGTRDDAVIVVRGDAPAEMTAALDDLAAQLRAEPQAFESVLHRRDLSRLKEKALYYLPPADLAGLEAQLSQAAAALPPAGQPADPAAMLARLNEQLAHVASATPEQRSAIEEQYARLTAPLSAALAGQASNLQMPPANSPLPPLNAALRQFNPQYLLADEGRLGFVLTRLVARKGEAAANAAAIARLRTIIRQTQPRHPQVWIGLTGMPVIEYDEMQASQTDMMWTCVLSLGLVVLLYLCAYGGLRHALLLNVVLVLATTYSFGFVTLAVGHLNILSSAFSAVLIGLGIDFSIHYVASYLKLRQLGLDEEESLLRTAVEVGPGVVTGGVTTAAAFFMAAMTDFIGVRELGLIAGGSILLCVASAIVILPPLVLLVDRRWPALKTPEILPVGRWVQWPLRRPRMTIAVAVLATIVIGAGSLRLRYDHNLLNLQPRHLESADIERQLLTRLDDSVWFAVSICQTQQELLERKARFEALPIVAKTEDIASLAPQLPQEHAQQVAELCRELAAIPDRPPAVRLDLAQLKREVARAQKLLAEETPYETPASILLSQLASQLAASEPAAAEARLAQASAVLFGQLTERLAPLRAMAGPVPPRLEDLPPELVDRFIGRNRTWLLKVYAKGNIWNMQELEGFVQAVESVDPRVTGHPVQTYYASRHMQSSYLRAGLYALAAVLVLLWIDFRSLAHSLLAMMPLAFGFAMLCGVIGWLDLPLNPANMIVLPLILGIGVDHGVHLVHLWRQQPGRFVLNDSTATAVLLTAATTTASFGALILARHQGLQSLGQVLTLGVTTCLASSIGLFPAMLAWLAERRAAQSEDGVMERRRDGETERQRDRETEGRSEGETERPMESEQHEVSHGTPQYASVPPSLHPSVAPSLLPSVPPSLPPSVPSPVYAQPPQTHPAPDLPAPVTDEEVAALLESALAPRLLRLADLPDDDTKEVAEQPRRRTPLRRLSAEDDAA